MAKKVNKAMSNDGAIKLSKRSIADLQKEAKATGQRLRRRDAETSWLLVDVSKAGKAAFYLRVRRNTELVFERLGDYGDNEGQLNVEKARAKGYKVLGKLEDGHNPKHARQLLRGEPTVRDLFNRYMKDHAKQNKKTWDDMQKLFDRSLNTVANRKASAVTRGDVVELKEKIAEDRGRYSANRALQLLRGVYNKAIRWELITCRNPVQGVELYKEEARDRFLNAEEIRRLFIVLNGDDPTPEARTRLRPFVLVSDHLRHFILLSIFTGARKRTLLSMRFSDIDENAGTWTIRETKNGRPQVISLTKNELDIISQRRRESSSDFVFEGSGSTGHLADIKRSWTTLRRMAGISDVTIHDLRRNLASWMASQNVNVALIKGALNHKDIKTTLKVYAWTSNDAEREARLQAHAAMLAVAGDSTSSLLESATNELSGGKIATFNRTKTRNRKKARR
jgi:integrase